jgi:hypothetical protein
MFRIETVELPKIVMTDTFPELPEWSFDADEVSPGVYRAFGCDRAGRNVEAFGPHPEALIQKCRQAAFEIMAQRQKPNNLSQS